MNQFNKLFTPFAASQMSLCQIREKQPIQKLAAGIFLIFLSLTAQAQAPIALPDGETGKPYNETFSIGAAAGAALPQTLEVVDSNGMALGLPHTVNGINVAITNLTVTVTGTPNTARTDKFSIRAKTAGGTAFDTFLFTLKVAPSFKVNFGAARAAANGCSPLGVVGVLPKNKNSSDDLTFQVANHFGRIGKTR